MGRGRILFHGLPSEEQMLPIPSLAGFGIGGAGLVGVSSVFLGLAAFALLRAVLPETAWWSVAARGFTTVLLAGSAGIIGWRMSRRWGGGGKGGGRAAAAKRARA